MGAPFKICRQRSACAVLASGVVISLTALTGGVAPALAEPGGGPAAPSTTVVPVPPAEAPSQAPSQAPVEAPPVVAQPSVAPAPPVSQSVEAPPPSRTPDPAPAPAPSSAPAPSPRELAPPSSAASSSAPPAPRDLPRDLPRDAPSSSAPAAPSAAPSPSPAPSSPSALPSTSTTVTTGDSTPPSPALVGPPPSPALVGPPPAPAGEPSGPSGPASPPASPPSAESPSSSASRGADDSSSATTSASASQPAPRVIEKVAPQTLEAPDADVQVAKTAKIVEEKPVEAPKQEIDDISRVIDLPNRDRGLQNGNGPRNDDNDNDNRNRNDDQVHLAGNWDRNVRQWRPDWVDYDEYYRPVLSNPYRDPVRIVYIYQNAPRVVWIPPLARIVLEVAQYAAYSFTAVVQNAVDQAVNVAVGSFFGGGYYPGVGQPPPPPPPPLYNYANVPVQVRYPDATYQPFRVSKIVDVGDDQQYGERKVLLDGVTPAWGEWKQTPSGERSFEVHKTQQFPGLDDPQPGPLPGDYQLRLASDETSSGMNKREVYLIAVAVACGALSIGAVLLSVIIGRRRRASH